jgi:hypothetical protein
MRGALCPTSSRRRVGIVASKGWSGWVAVAAGLGWDIAWVAVEDSQLGQAWRRDLATQAIRHLPYQEYSPTLVSESGVDVLLLDTQLPVAGAAIWQASSLQFVIGARLPRRGSVPLGWTSNPLEWTHANCGGVSGTSGVLHCAGRSADAKIKLPKIPRRQLSSILSTTEGGRSTPPPSPAAWPPRVTPTAKSGFHGEGLFPMGYSSPWVDMPDCLSRTGWVRRKLTRKELLTVADVPVDSHDLCLYASGTLEMARLLHLPIGVLHLVGVELNGLLSKSPKSTETPPVAECGGLLDYGVLAGGGFRQAKVQCPEERRRKRKGRRESGGKE